MGGSLLSTTTDKKGRDPEGKCREKTMKYRRVGKTQKRNHIMYNLENRTRKGVRRRKRTREGVRRVGDRRQRMQRGRGMNFV